MNRIRIVAAAAAAALATPLLAQFAPPAATPMTLNDAEAAAKAKFDRTDANHDGVVTRDEVMAAMAIRIGHRRANMTTAPASRFDTLDGNHDGQLSRDEFAAGRPMAWRGRGAAMKDKTMDGAALANRWFALADADKNGRVSPEEANALAATRFRKSDTNGDGTISTDERNARHENMKSSREKR